MFTVGAGRDLFHRVILQSGTALSPGAMMYNPLPTTEALTARVNCSQNDNSEGFTLRLLHCLKQVRALTLSHRLFAVQDTFSESKL